MGKTPIAHPSLTQIAAALRGTTEILAREVTAPTGEPPLWGEVEWRIAQAVSAMQGVSTLLCDRLRWQHPLGWRRFLESQREQSLLRHVKIVGLLDAIDSQARHAGVALVALKGATLIANQVYSPGERPMGDIDLLVRDMDADAVARVLGACGYDIAFTSRRHRVFQSRVRQIPPGVSFGEHIDHPIKVEVHTRIAEHLPFTAVDITDRLWPLAAHGGLNAYPTAASLMLHLLLHAAGNMRARALRLIQLHDIALLADRFSPGDWEALLAIPSGGGPLWWAFAPLILVDRYYRGRIPWGLLAQLEAECPRMLVGLTRRRQLADVSWSNIRIAAFPGVEWSRTPLDALRFIGSRLWPSREARLELVDGAAQIPDSVTIPWYGIPHTARLLRWIFSRPPRVQTMLSVRAALAQDL